MFERLKRFVKKLTDGDPDSYDPSRPQRANPNPPERDWYARVRDRSEAARRARAVAETRALDANDGELSEEASQHVDEVLARMASGTQPKAPPR